MKTKIVYVLVSTDKDFYLEQAYVSMYSAKYHMPDAHITLLVDRLTEESFVGKRKEMLRYVDELVVVDLGRSLKGQKRSRLLKTSVRLHLQGDFLFVDCDTVVVKPLYEIDLIKNDISACWDTHALFKENPYRDLCIRHANILGFSLEAEETYYNSGVIYVKDNACTHQFYRNWHENYLIGYEKGVSMDQPSFAKTNIAMNHVLRTLPDRWNCELKHGIRFLGEARIVHYLGTDKVRGEFAPLFIMNDPTILRNIKETGLVPKSIEEVINDPFKGLANVTHCFAGRDVYLFRSRAFTCVKRLFYEHPFLFMILSAQLFSMEICFAVMNKLNRCIKSLINNKRGG